TESNNPTNKPFQIGRITTAGVITEFPIPSDNASPLGIAKGPDGALWFTESSLANKIGRLVLPGGCNKPLTDTHDFNADCLSDVLWYNTGNGQVVNWLVSATSVIGGGSLGSVPSPWAIIGQRDFNGDGFADILWRNGATGDVVIWLLDGRKVIGVGPRGLVSTDWTIMGTGDFNRDGKGDILWYNIGTGQVVLWFINGTTVIGGGSPGTISPFSSSWTIMTGDFNGDGFTDILWFNQGD